MDNFVAMIVMINELLASAVKNGNHTNISFCKAVRVTFNKYARVEGKMQMSDARTPCSEHQWQAQSFWTWKNYSSITPFSNTIYKEQQAFLAKGIALSTGRDDEFNCPVGCKCDICSGWNL